MQVVLREGQLPLLRDDQAMIKMKIKGLPSVLSDFLIHGIDRWLSGTLFGNVRFAVGVTLPDPNKCGCRNALCLG